MCLCTCKSPFAGHIKIEHAVTKQKDKKERKKKKKGKKQEQKVDYVGIEPTTSRMRSGRTTTVLTALIM